MIALFVIGDTILYVPANVAGQARQSAWISGVLALAAGLCLVALYGGLAGRFPGKTLIEMCRESFGSWLGAAVGLALVAYFFIDSGIILWEVGDFMVTHIMPETPILSFLILFMLVVVMGYRLGVGTFGRAADILFFFVVVLFLTLVVLLTPEMKMERMKPLFEPGPKPIAQGALLLTGYYFESVIIFMLLPAVQGSRGHAKAYMFGMAIGGGVLAMTIAICILVLGADLTEMQLFTTYVLAKKISIGDFLERIEVIMASLWFLTLFCKLYVCYYASVVGLSQLLNIGNTKLLSLPMAVVVIVLSLTLVPNITYFSLLILKTWWAYTATFGIFLPLLLLGAGLFKKKGPQKS
ncbi:MAG: gerKB [Paenibacillus sp.]|nr:gerKB [Paenibacillus sp.]